MARGRAGKIVAVWVRGGDGRIEKVFETTTAFKDVTIIGSDNSTAIEMLIVQHKIKGKSSYRKVAWQPCEIVRLPRELLVMISRLVSVRDVAALATTCKALSEFFSHNFVQSVILPLSAGNRRKLANRSILDLRSSVDVSIWEKDQYLAMVKEMNLTNVKRLKFNGPNFRGTFYLALPRSYLAALDHFISNGRDLEALDILIDNSDDVLRLVGTAARLLHLQEVTLRSCGDIGRITRFEQTDTDMNKLIRQLLEHSNIKKLVLKGFSVPWDHKGTSDQYFLNIESNSIETLTVEYSKCFELGRINAKNLKEINIASNYNTFCLYHADPHRNEAGNYVTDGRMGKLAPKLARGCPSLHSFNGLDIGALRRRAEGGDWLHLLVEHKGEAVVGEFDDDGFSGGCNACRWGQEGD
jgi:hypothetical protein